MSAPRFQPGDRVIFCKDSPWPERVGCEGVVVAPRSDGIYSQPVKGETLVLLDADPLRVDGSVHGWSCVTTSKSLALIWSARERARPSH
jgi:hypothetical protein